MKPHLSFAEYQAAASTTAVYQPGDLPYLGLGLNGEAGEVAEIIKRLLRKRAPLDAESITKIRLELGDCLWYIAQIATECGLSLPQIAEDNLAKLGDRQTRGVLEGKGDER